MNRRLRENKAGASHPRPATLKKERLLINNQSSAIATRVKELENFIVGAPLREQEQRIQNHNIVPPPDFDFSHGGERLSEKQRMCYGRQQRLQRVRHRNLAFFLALLCAAIGFLVWFLRFIT